MLAGLDASELVLHWHGDRLRLPQGATLLASSLHCPEQMYRLGEQAFGLQFHVELLPGDLERWIQEDSAYVAEALGPGGADRLRHGDSLWGERVRRQGRRLIDNLLDHLAGHG